VTPAVATTIPRSGSRLSGGLVSEASVTARLLGIRLLTLDATIVIAPAEFAGPPPRQRSEDGVIDADAALGPRAVERSSARALPRAGTTARASRVGSGLAEAARCIDESAASLAAARAR
jgi:hypothetical protein